jgi:hypothetical protein
MGDTLVGILAWDYTGSDDDAVSDGKETLHTECFVGYMQQISQGKSTIVGLNSLALRYV